MPMESDQQTVSVVFTRALLSKNILKAKQQTNGRHPYKNMARGIKD